jgi:hypothetical protein
MSITVKGTIVKNAAMDLANVDINGCRKVFFISITQKYK